MTNIILKEEIPTEISDEDLYDLLQKSNRVGRDAARAKLVKLALVNPKVKQAVIDDAMNHMEASAYTLSDLARKGDQESFNALIETAKKGRSIAISELGNFPDNNEVKQTVIELTKNGHEAAITVFVSFLRNNKKDSDLRRTAFEISNLFGHDSAIKGLVIISDEDKKAKKRVMERAMEGSQSAMYSVYDWTLNGDEQARRVLFGSAAKGNYNAREHAFSLVSSLVEQKKDNGALSFLIKQSTDRTEDPKRSKSDNKFLVETRMSFAIKQLVSLVSKGTITEEIKARIMTKLYELRTSNDTYEVEELKHHLDHERSKIGPIPDVLKPLIEDFFGAPPEFHPTKSFIPQPPTVVYVTRYSSISDDEKYAKPKRYELSFSQQLHLPIYFR